MRTPLQTILLMLNLACLACYGAAALVFMEPFRKYLEGSAFGYGNLLASIVALGTAGLLSSAVGGLSIFHLVRERRWTWDLSLSVLNCALIPGLVLAWSLLA